MRKIFLSGMSIAIVILVLSFLFDGKVVSWAVILSFLLMIGIVSSTNNFVEDSDEMFFFKGLLLFLLGKQAFTALVRLNLLEMCLCVEVLEGVFSFLALAFFLILLWRYFVFMCKYETRDIEEKL